MVEKLTPARRRELTRAALLDAAASVFAQRGFEGASLDEIAEAAGFTRGAIYKNFDGKEDLFFAVFDLNLLFQRAKQMVEEVASAVSPTSEPCKHLIRLLRSQVVLAAFPFDTRDLLEVGFPGLASEASKCRLEED